LLLLLAPADNRGRLLIRNCAGVLPLVAAIVLLGFLSWRFFSFFRPQLTGFAAQTKEHESRLGTFMRYDDSTVFSSVEFPHTPYPIADRLVSLLRDPFIRDALPAPLQRERFRFSNLTAFNQVQTGPLTIMARFVLRFGYIFIIAAGMLFLYGVWIGRSTTSD
jgi:hypothetical protein